MPKKLWITGEEKARNLANTLLPHVKSPLPTKTGDVFEVTVTLRLTKTEDGFNAEFIPVKMKALMRRMRALQEKVVQTSWASLFGKPFDLSEFFAGLDLPFTFNKKE